VKSCFNCGRSQLNPGQPGLLCTEPRGAAWRDHTNPGVCALPGAPDSPSIVRINALRCETLATYCSVYIEESCA
jgi:hypothetical protein